MNSWLRKRSSNLGRCRCSNNKDQSVPAALPEDALLAAYESESYGSCDSLPIKYSQALPNRFLRKLHINTCWRLVMRSTHHHYYSWLSIENNNVKPLDGILQFLQHSDPLLRGNTYLFMGKHWFNNNTESLTPRQEHLFLVSYIWSGKTLIQVSYTKVDSNINNANLRCYRARETIRYSSFYGALDTRVEGLFSSYL